jgi:hypothetical protein
MTQRPASPPQTTPAIIPLRWLFNCAAEDRGSEAAKLFDSRVCIGIGGAIEPAELVLTSNSATVVLNLSVLVTSRYAQAGIVVPAGISCGNLNYIRFSALRVSASATLSLTAKQKCLCNCLPNWTICCKVCIRGRVNPKEISLTEGRPLLDIFYKHSLTSMSRCYTCNHLLEPTKGQNASCAAMQGRRLLQRRVSLGFCTQVFVIGGWHILVVLVLQLCKYAWTRQGFCPLLFVICKRRF